MIIARQLYDEIVAHALEDAGNEVCGVVATDAEVDEALRVFRAANIHASPLKFEIEPLELLKLNSACEELGRLGAIYHSHVRTDPYPSQTDITYAGHWPGVEWIIVGLASGADPEVRSYAIEDSVVREVPLEVS